MSNTIAKMNGSRGPAVATDSAMPWTPLRDLLGFDPFQNIRSTYGYEYDVSRTETGYEVEIPVPGYNASTIDVTFKDGVLNLAGKTDRRSFTRSFTIPEDVDANAIGARVADGMLTISLKRRPEAQPQKIQVN